MPKGYSEYLKAIETAAQHRRDIEFFGYFSAHSEAEFAELIEPLGLSVAGYSEKLKPVVASRNLRGGNEPPAILQVCRSYHGEHIWRLQLLWAGPKYELPEELAAEIRRLLARSVDHPYDPNHPGEGS